MRSVIGATAKAFSRNDVLLVRAIIKKSAFPAITDICRVLIAQLNNKDSRMLVF